MVLQEKGLVALEKEFEDLKAEWQIARNKLAAFTQAGSTYKNSR